VPVLAYHGGYDDVLSYQWVKAIYDRHMKDCPSFDFRLIPDLSHSVTVEELEESTRWMEDQLKKHGVISIKRE
jgi:predicted esterase